MRKRNPNKIPKKFAVDSMSSDSNIYVRANKFTARFSPRLFLFSPRHQISLDAALPDAETSAARNNEKFARLIRHSFRFSNLFSLLFSRGGKSALYCRSNEFQLKLKAERSVCKLLF